MYDLAHITKKAYEFYKEKKTEKGRVWFDTETYTIHVEGGNLTVRELYDECQKMLKKDPTMDLPFEIEPEE